MPYYVPAARDEWNEIVPNLFMGGHVYDPMQKFSSPWLPVVVRDEFDSVVSLYTESGSGPSVGVPHVICEIPDDKENGLNDGGLFMVELIADLVADAVKSGKKVLVRCQAGYNRSGLVVAFALMRMGYTGPQAIQLIRQKRSPHALCNERFVEYIQNHKPVLEESNA
jgi:protein-tyrosine phosphatase